MTVSNGKRVADVLDELIVGYRPDLEGDINEKFKHYRQALAVLKEIMVAVKPEPVDLASKYEGGEVGLNITVDEENDTVTGENLAHLAQYASDKGWNEAIEAFEQNIRQAFSNGGGDE